MYMGDSHLRQQTINEVDGIFMSYTCTCLHSSDLGTAFWLLRVIFQRKSNANFAVGNSVPLFRYVCFQ